MVTLKVWVIFLLSLGTLVWAADRFIVGAIAVSNYFNIPKALIGATIVAIGTSAPELVLSITASAHNESDIVLGNIIGSNISNIAIVFLPCVLLSRAVLDKQIPQTKLKMLFLVTALASFLIYFDSPFRFISGIALIITSIATLYLMWKSAMDGNNSGETNLNEPFCKRSLASLVIGVSLLPVSSYYLLDSGLKVADIYDISKLFVGLFLMAVGTSLPEMATSISAVLRKENSLAVGNIVGSNIMNLSLVLGTAALVQPIYVSDITKFRDIPVMILFTVALPLLYSRRLKKHRVSICLLLITAYLFYIISSVR